MSNYEHYDLGDSPYGRPAPQPTWSPDAFLIGGELPPNYFELDMEIFRAATERINRLIPIEAEPPEHMTKLTRTTLLPFSKNMLIMQAMRQKGYDISWVRHVEDNSDGQAASVTVYTRVEDRPAVQKVGKSVTTGKSLYASLLWDITCATLQHSHFIPGHGAHNMLDPQYALIDGVQGETLRRAFMTSALVRRLKPWVLSGGVADITRQDALLYNVFRAQGLESFSYEDLFGMAERLVTEVLQSDPKIPAPYAVQKKQEDIFGPEW